MEEWWSFPFPHNSSPVAGAECPAAHDRGSLLDHSRVVQVPRSAGSECVASNGYFLAPCRDLFTAKQWYGPNSPGRRAGHLNAQ